MQIISIILGYLGWHYGKALYSLSNIWKNFLYFVFEFFSIRLLFKNFSDPWKRMADSYPKSFDLKKYFYAFLANLIMRVFGMVMRLVLIMVGLFCYFIVILFYPLVLIFWLLLPLIVLGLLGSGIILIIK